MRMRVETSPEDRGKFFSDVLYWCFRWGCDVTLRNTVKYDPVMNVKDVYSFGEDHERQRDGTLVDVAHHMKRERIEYPELYFSRGNRHVLISADSWYDLIERFKYEHKKIYMELTIPMFNGFSRGGEG